MYERITSDDLGWTYMEGDLINFDEAETCQSLDNQSALNGILSKSAREEGTLEVVQHLLDQGADVNFPDSETGMTPLMLAVENGAPELCTLLLSRGARVNNRHQSTGNTALHLAARMGNLETVKILVKHQSDPTLCNEMGDDPLREACSRCQVEIVRYLTRKFRFPSDRLLEVAEILGCAAVLEGNLYFAHIFWKASFEIRKRRSAKKGEAMESEQEMLKILNLDEAALYKQTLEKVQKFLPKFHWMFVKTVECFLNRPSLDTMEQAKLFGNVFSSNNVQSTIKNILWKIFKQNSAYGKRIEDQDLLEISNELSGKKKESFLHKYMRKLSDSELLFRAPKSAKPKRKRTV